MPAAPYTDCAIERVASPIGDVVLVHDGAALLRLDFADHSPVADRSTAGRRSRFGEAVEAYFAGAVDALDGLAVSLAGTEFEQGVWQMLRQIPPGRTWSYRELAAAIGRPKAVRAVGRANGRNPVSLVLPCHRVIGADGSLTGYGGGLERKAWLLRHEGVLVV